jgi:lipopolysaccharide biosynthesis glycosyltransferase
MGVSEYVGRSNAMLEMATQPAEVLFTLDEKFRQQLAVAVRTAVDSAPPRSLRINIVQVNPDRRANEELMRSWSDLDANIRFVTLHPGMLRGMPETGRFTRSIWIRCMAAELLPRCERVIYLDCDVVVRDDLTELWRTNLHGQAVGAVTDYMGTFGGVAGTPTSPEGPAVAAYAELGFTGAEPYFNSGVMLCDLTQWRAMRASDQIRRFAVSNASRLRYPDQEALNVVFCGRWQELDSGWNALGWVSLDKHGRFTQALRELPQARILHFTGLRKPWLPNYPGLIGPLIYGSALASVQAQRTAPMVRAQVG